MSHRSINNWKNLWDEYEQCLENNSVEAVSI